MVAFLLVDAAVSAEAVFRRVSRQAAGLGPVNEEVVAAQGVWEQLSPARREPKDAVQQEREQAQQALPLRELQEQELPQARPEPRVEHAQAQAQALPAPERPVPLQLEHEPGQRALRQPADAQASLLLRIGHGIDQSTSFTVSNRAKKPSASVG